MRGCAYWVTTTLSLTLAGCSELVIGAVFNNTESSIQICNPSLHSDACQTIQPHAEAAVTLVADQAASSWRFRITSNQLVATYDLGNQNLYALSTSHCSRVPHGRRCIGLQLQSDGKLYWVDSADAMPVATFPKQPSGFPVLSR